MNLKQVFLSALGVIALVSCNSETVEPSDFNELLGETDAYVSISLSAPLGTRAYSREEAGSANEGFATNNTVVIACFDVAKNCVNKKTESNVAVTGSNLLKSFKVSSKTKDILVFINPPVAISNAIAVGKNYKAINLAIKGLSNADAKASYYKENNFVLASAGQNPGDMGLTKVTPTVIVGNGDAEAKVKAEEHPTRINVVRLVSRVKVTAAADLKKSAMDQVEFQKWDINATNRCLFPYSELATITSEKGKYRIDPNYAPIANTIEALNANFNWLHNPGYEGGENPVWKDKDDTGYSLENTMDVAAFNYNNATKVLVKATYVPAALNGEVTLGQTWFQSYESGKYYSLEGIKEAYQSNKLSPAEKSNLDAIIAKVPAVATISELTEEKITEALGYQAATIDNPILQCFAKSVNFYTVNLNHDDALGTGLLGRWGLLRNNAYEVTINKISKQGTPYIPDPTDPTIKDPVNPDPTTPDPLDPLDENSYISVDITVSDWTIWTQGVSL